MIFQKVVKGISGIDTAAAQDIIDKGLKSNWYRVAGTILEEDKKIHLTAKNLDLHLNHYHQNVPTTNPLSSIHRGKFGDVSPFISTTAGVVQRNGAERRNIIFSSYITALKFATSNFKKSGFIFYTYVITVGKKAVEMEQFAEDIRNLNVYKEFQEYNSQGEVMAKIIIPSVQIEKAEMYVGAEVKKQIRAGKPILPKLVLDNHDYQAPEQFSNIHDMIL
jgi:hypothetical protein